MQERYNGCSARGRAASELLRNSWDTEESSASWGAILLTMSVHAAAQKPEGISSSDSAMKTCPSSTSGQIVT